MSTKKDNKSYNIAATLVTKENAIKKSFAKLFNISSDFEFFRHLAHPYGP